MVANLVVLAGLAAALSGCDLNRPASCGPNQQTDELQFCVCAPNAVPGPGHGSHCVLCGVNQIARGEVCECAPGFARDAVGACVVIPPGLAAPCTPGGLECSTSAFPFCALSAAKPYCTASGCTSHAQCPLDYLCDASSAPPFCRKAPAGQGSPCESDATCAGTDANLCLPVLNQCVVQGCTLGGTGCPRGATCCDLTSLGLAKLVCLPGGMCP